MPRNQGLLALCGCLVQAHDQSSASERSERHKRVKKFLFVDLGQKNELALSPSSLSLSSLSLSVPSSLSLSSSLPSSLPVLLRLDFCKLTLAPNLQTVRVA